MKNTHLLTISLSLVLFTISCQHDEVSDINDTEQIEQSQPDQEHLDFLKTIHVNTDNVTIENIKHPDGNTNQYLVSSDIAIPMTRYNDFKESKSSGNKQYRSKYKVKRKHRNITVGVLTPDVSGNAGLNSKMRRGLCAAIHRQYP